MINKPKKMCTDTCGTVFYWYADNVACEVNHRYLIFWLTREIYNIFNTFLSLRLHVQVVIFLSVS